MILALGLSIVGLVLVAYLSRARRVVAREPAAQA